MDKLSLKKIAITVEKMNFLYRSIRDHIEQPNHIELMLLKQYSLELYEFIIELEQKQKEAKKAVFSPEVSVPVAVLVENTPKLPDTDAPPLAPPPLPPEDINELHSVVIPPLDAILEPEDMSVQPPPLPTAANEESHHAASDIFETLKELGYGVETPPTPETTPPPVSNTETNETATNSSNLIEEEWIAEDIEVADEPLFEIIPTLPTPEITITNEEPIIEQPIIVTVEAPKTEANMGLKTSVLDQTLLEQAQQLPVSEPPEAETPIEAVLNPLLLGDETVALRPGELNQLFQPQTQIESQSEELSLADKLAGQTNNKDSLPINMSQKFAFIKTLFNGNEQAYQRTIQTVVNSKGYIEALTYINLNVRHEMGWQDHDPTVKEFIDIIKHKFLD